MNSFHLAAVSALIATGLLFLDAMPMNPANATASGMMQRQMINRDAKAARLMPSQASSQDQAAVHIETDHERGMTTVNRKPPRQEREISTGETDFAMLWR